VFPDGATQPLDGGRGFPLGVDVASKRELGMAKLPVGGTLVLFTDGLVERAGHPIERGRERLRRAAGARAGHEPERLCDELVAELVDAPTDDVAVVCLRLDRHPDDFEVWRFPALPGEIASARHVLCGWLAEQAVSEEVCADIAAAVSEACSNVARHAYRAGEGEMILSARRDRGGLTIRVRDTGRWTDGTGGDDEGGWGIDIIRALVDDLHVHGTPYGTTVIMRRRLAPMEGAAVVDSRVVGQAS
jgi:anti-sigma regulatory factor (Ser/Thr protein kinase)